jgi:hypothetical protein
MDTDENSHVLGISQSIFGNFKDGATIYILCQIFYQKVHLPLGSLLMSALYEEMEPQTEMRPRDLICEITALLSVPPT